MGIELVANGGITVEIKDVATGRRVGYLVITEDHIWVSPDQGKAQRLIWTAQAVTLVDADTAHG